VTKRNRRNVNSISVDCSQRNIQKSSKLRDSLVADNSLYKIPGLSTPKSKAFLSQRDSRFLEYNKSEVRSPEIEVKSLLKVSASIDM